MVGLRRGRRFIRRDDMQAVRQDDDAHQGVRVHEHHDARVRDPSARAREPSGARNHLRGLVCPSCLSNHALGVAEYNGFWTVRVANVPAIAEALGKPRGTAHSWVRRRMRWRRRRCSWVLGVSPDAGAGHPARVREEARSDDQAELADLCEAAPEPPVSAANSRRAANPTFISAN